MDIKNLMNDGPAKNEERKRSPDSQRSSHPPPPPLLNTQSSSHCPYASQSQSQTQTPLYNRSTSISRPQSGVISQSAGSGQFSLHTPVRETTNDPHTFPSQSPASAVPGSQYRHVDGPLPLTRPPSQGYAYGQQQVSQQTPMTLYPGRFATSSNSPTPPSHHTQSPSSLRQSPLMSMHAPAHYFATQSAQHHYPYTNQQSYQPAPSTPLGPPQHVPQRVSTFHERSPFAQHHQETSGALDSFSRPPSMHGSPSSHRQQSPQQLRRASEYAGGIVRQQSESVSPKTILQQRPNSSSRQSSQQMDLHKNNAVHTRDGMNAVADASTYPAPLQSSVTPQPFQARVPDAASEARIMAQGNSFSANDAGLARSESLSFHEQSVAEVKAQTSPEVQHHHTREPSMSNLLLPMEGAPRPANATTEKSSMNNKQLPADQQVEAAGYERPPSREVQPPQAGKNSRVVRKRPADSEPTGGPPAAKHRKVRKYLNPPIWAQLSKHNPKIKEQVAQLSKNASGHQTNGASAHAQQTNGRPAQSRQTNGATHNTDIDGRPPWQQDPPLDYDLIRPRRILGQWEKSFRWNTPYPSMLKEVQNWLWMELSKLGDVGVDPREGIVEIEAKFGTLLQNDTNDRCALPVLSATVIDPRKADRDYRFESRMTPAEHYAMNKWLNASTQDSQARGRSSIAYTHLHEIDSFSQLSPLGLKTLPPAFHSRSHQKVRKPRLRTTRTYDAKTKTSGAITARIVKLNLSNLHIFNPLGPFDTRISINLEINLNDPSLDHDALVMADTPAEIDRVKDRVSYKHLNCYSIDLTKVSCEGLTPTYELELEVDAALLREQMRVMGEGKGESCFGEVVAGFLDDASFLMDYRAPPQPAPAPAA